ncbi:MAG: DUF4384 domain-containing protein [Calditrichaeota bacterium]|nr:DUF4384 domain-containing protein [Calditrichota bacterium]
MSSWLSVYAQEWHTGEGLIIMANITPEQARAEAIQGARKDALEAAGVELIGITTSHIREVSGSEAYDMFARFTRSITRGRIVSEEILFDDQEKLLEVWHYRIKLRAQVAMNIGEPDPTFRVDLKLNRQIYRDGEPMALTISATRDCYITIFNLYANDSLSVILPNRYQLCNHIKGRDTLMVPPPDAAWELPVELAADCKEGSEAVMIVAVRDDISFTARDASIRNGLISVSDALTAINRWLVDIPADRRTEDIEYYVIVK